MHCVGPPPAFASSSAFRAQRDTERRAPRSICIAEHGEVEVEKEKRVPHQEPAYCRVQWEQLLVVDSAAHQGPQFALVSQFDDCGSRRDQEEQILFVSSDAYHGSSSALLVPLKDSGNEKCREAQLLIDNNGIHRGFQSVLVAQSMNCDGRMDQAELPLFISSDAHQGSPSALVSKSNCSSPVDQEEQLLCVNKDAHQGFPSALIAQLKECGHQRDLRRGSKIHADIFRKGLLQENIFLGTSLISMYAKCGALEKAKEVFDELPSLNGVAWNALIAGYVQHDKAKEAFHCYEEMQHDGFFPDSFTFSCILKACGSLEALEKGREIHALVMQQNLLEKDSVVANALVDMYAKCGALDMAHEVLEKFCSQDNISWNALIGGYTQHGHGEIALTCFRAMQEKGLSPDIVTLSCALKACGSIGDPDRGREIHAHIVRLGKFGNCIILGTTLVDMYTKCCVLEEAQDIFDDLPAHDVVAWNVLIAGYAQCEYGKEALHCFERMKLEGISPNSVTYSCILSACGSLRDLDKAHKMHMQLLREHSFGKDIMLSTALVDMYAQCSALDEAQAVFDELWVKDVASWNALIAGYVQHGLGEDALYCFKQMRVEGFTPNAVTFECALKACGSIGALEKGEEIHDQVHKISLLEKSSRVAKALVDMYFKCGAPDKAQGLFDKLPERDADFWNVLITGYTQHEYYEEVSYCFGQMQYEGFSPNAVTFTCILKACGSMGTLYQGQMVHIHIVRFGMLNEGVVIGTALVNMYASCGMIREAQDLFDCMLNKDVVCWSALMEGYAQLGDDEAVFDLFEQMQEQGVEPSSVTFTIVLNACSHSGLVLKGEAYLEMLNRVYNILPSIEHQTCIVDLLSRAGGIDVAVAAIEEMAVSASISMWHTLLSASRHVERMKLGRWAFKNSVQVDEYNAAAYVSLENVLCG